MGWDRSNLVDLSFSEIDPDDYLVVLLFERRGENAQRNILCLPSRTPCLVLCPLISPLSDRLLTPYYVVFEMANGSGS